MKTFFKLAVSLSVCSVVGISSAYAGSYRSYKSYMPPKRAGTVRVIVIPEYNHWSGRYEADYCIRWGSFKECRIINQNNNNKRYLYYNHYYNGGNTHNIYVYTRNRGEIWDICQPLRGQYDYEWFCNDGTGRY